MTELIRMTRDPVYGKPFAADVHPDEVDNYARVGFVREGEAAAPATVAPAAPEKAMTPLGELRKQAKALGVKFGPRTTAEALKAGIEKARANG